MAETCKQCEHYRATGERLGECRRYPPAKPAQFFEDAWQFPVVKEEFSCGEWKTGIAENAT